MNVQFLNPFVEAAYEVLRVELGADISRGDLNFETGPYRTDDVTVVIALVGAVEGTVFYSMSKGTAIRIASHTIGEEFQDLEGLAQSGIAELGNVITGRASMKLSQAGYEATISPPSLILGSGATISTLDFPRLIVPLLTAMGPMTVHLALRAGANLQVKTAHLAVPKAPIPQK
ncbi:MAG TPA: chemotaxis protein CheX [Anaerolineaceae bacterium]|nr:chemotaxis protein CheX [Anaerolineaceae bacterium]